MDEDKDPRGALATLMDLIEAADNPSVVLNELEPEWSRNWNAYVVSVEINGFNYTLALNDR